MILVYRIILLILRHFNLKLIAATGTHVGCYGYPPAVHVGEAQNCRGSRGLSLSHHDGDHGARGCPQSENFKESSDFLDLRNDFSYDV